jgi:hypothetical protein
MSLQASAGVPQALGLAVFALLFDLLEWAINSSYSFITTEMQPAFLELLPAFTAHACRSSRRLSKETFAVLVTVTSRCWQDDEPVELP